MKDYIRLTKRCGNKIMCSHCADGRCLINDHIHKCDGIDICEEMSKCVLKMLCEFEDIYETMDS